MALLIKIFPLITLASYLIVTPYPKFRLIEKFIAIFLFAYISINLDINYFSDFPLYVEWISEANLISHRDYVFSQIMKVLNIFPNAEISLRVFLFLFYSLLIMVFCKHNVMLFVTSPVILDCLFNSQRAGIALSLIAVFFFKKPILNAIAFFFVFFIHRYLSIFMIVTQSTKKLKLNPKFAIIIWTISVILFFNSDSYHSALSGIRTFAYFFIDYGKGWDEFFLNPDESLRQVLSRFLNLSAPAILTILCFKHVNIALLYTILITTSFILILGPSFSSVYRLSIIPYLLLTQVEIKRLDAQLLKTLMIIIGSYNLIVDIEYTV